MPISARISLTFSHTPSGCVDPHFSFRVPVAVKGVDAKILNPRDTWADKKAYDAQARKLVAMFQDNFKKFESHVGPDVLQAAPHLAEAAE